MNGLSRKSLEELMLLAMAGAAYLSDAPPEGRKAAEIARWFGQASTDYDHRLLSRARAALLPREKRATRGRGARAKGKHAELEVVQLLRPFFPGCKRGYQTRGGGKEQADVTETGPFHVEVKRKESLNLYDALEQAVRDAGEGKIPLVLHRRNDRPWVAILTAEAFLDIFRRSDLCGGEPTEPLEGQENKS